MEEKCKAQRINLFCPSLSKLSSIVAWDDQRLDLGTIARTFGIEPSTLKLNGHFISRGVDLVASSVTWKSLLSFFSARGLSTGIAGSPALIVDGKLCKSGAKRSHDSVGVGKAETVAVTANSQSNPKKLKVKEKRCDGLGLKRKLWVDAISPLKRIRTDGTYSNNTFCKSYEEKGKEMAGSGEAMKRGREEVLVGSACKRMR